MSEKKGLTNILGHFRVQVEVSYFEIAEKSLGGSVLLFY